MPKSAWHGYERFCPFARALDIVGERWTLVILHHLLGGPARYTDLKSGLPGIGTNVLSDRLRKLEEARVVRRTAGAVGDGVRYELTERGWALAPAMAELRRWGADELLADPDTTRCYDFSYALPDELALTETYEWRLDGRSQFLTIDDRVLCQQAAPTHPPSVTVTTSIDFMRRWAAGEVTWEAGRTTGEVAVDGDDDAWDRMLVATNYPGRPADLIDAVLARQHNRPR